MNPAYSIIFFTTASGAGYGLLAVLGIYGWLGALPDSVGFAASTLGVGVVLVAAGLISSTYHLGHPERAWRAFSQWRSSWLSREGVAAVATFLPIVALALGWMILGDRAQLVQWAGLLTTVGCVVTVVCTAMIYASLKAIPRWHNPWVPWVYLALGAMTGSLWLAVIAALTGVELDGLNLGAAMAVAIAFAVKGVYWARASAEGSGSSRESATGLGRLGGRAAKVSPLEPPHTEENYLQREMGYVIARKHAQRLREHTALLAFALPLFFVVLGLVLGDIGSSIAFLLAAVSASIGVVLERWLFFAEAKHVMSLYY